MHSVCQKEFLSSIWETIRTRIYDDIRHCSYELIVILSRQLETMPTADVEAGDPAGLKVELMQHQKQALAWLQWREQQHPPGGILGKISKIVHNENNMTLNVNISK